MSQGSWVAASDTDEFLRTTIPLLSADAARNTLILTVFDRLRSDGPHAFGERDPQMLTWYDAQGDPVGAALRTPPHAYLLSELPGEGITALVDLLYDLATGFDGREINLPESGEAAFTAAWMALTGIEPEVIERFRLHRLERLVQPDPAPLGSARRATQDDVEFVARWLRQFWAETEPSMSLKTGISELRAVPARIAEGVYWLWIDESGAPVSLAGFKPIVAGTGRVGPVYTPAESRGHGYAAGATVAATRAVIERGADEVLLFTDLANPVSNRLYQRLGYQPVSDRARLGFSGWAGERKPTASGGIPVRPAG